MAKRSASFNNSSNKRARSHDGGVCSNFIIKGAWSPEEDARMVEAVERHGTQDWRKIAQCVGGRSAKQCRDRYKLKLDPNINHNPWTLEEDEMLLQLQAELGRRWTRIAEKMPGRTENSVKSRFASLQRSKTREWSEEEDELLRRLKGKEDLAWEVIANEYMPHRSVYAVRKRWEKLFMRELAKKIREDMKKKGSEESTNGYDTSESSGPTPNDTSDQLSAMEDAASEPLIPPSETHLQLALDTTIPEVSLIKQADDFLSPPVIKQMDQNLPPNTQEFTHPAQALQRLPSGERGIKVEQDTVGAIMNKIGLGLDPIHPPSTDCANLTDPVATPPAVPAIRPCQEVSLKMPHPFEFVPSERESAMQQSERVAKGLVSGISSRRGRFKRHSTSMTVMMQVLGEPLES